MAKITVNLVGDSKDIDAKIKQVKQNIDQLSKQPIKLTLDTNGVSSFDKSVISAINAQARLEKARADLAKTNARVTIEERKLQQQQQRTAQETQKVASETQRANRAATEYLTTMQKEVNIGKQATLEQAKLATQTEKTRTQEARMGAEAEKASGKLKTMGKSAKEAGEGLTLIDNIVKNAQWYLISGGVSAAVNSFKDAIATMKEVDSELASVQKVTNETDFVIEKLGETAFETASKYGVAATDYLAAAGDFAKAGYDNYAALSELSTKTQLVGDVTADIASQFILSSDAAWKFKGNAEQLTTVLDEANAVENNYATSIQKIAEGMPIVASTAAQAGMSVEETMAALGTITSVTQESGSKAATALRALILNLMGDVGEYGDFDVTTDSVKNLTDALNAFAPEAMKAAEESGKLINPLTAIKSLAEASRNGLVSEKELFSILSGLGGKLRTNQLTALVTNFGMLEDQLETIQTSAGSSDREIAVMLDTWEAKSNQLSNTWNEFIADLLDTNQVKAGIDGLITVVQLLDTELGQAVVTVGAITLGFGALGRAVEAVGKTKAVSTFITSIQSAESVTAALSATMLASPLFAVAVGVAAVYGIAKAVDYFTLSLDEAKAKVEEINTEYENTFGQGSEFDDLSSRVGTLTEQEERRLDVLRAQKEAMEEQLRLARQTEFETYQKGQTETTLVDRPDQPMLGVREITTAYSNLERFNNAIADSKKAYEEGKISATDYKGALANLISEQSEYVDELKEYKDLGFELLPEQEAMIDSYDRLVLKYGELTEAGTESAEAMELARDTLSQQITDLTTLSDELTGATDAINDFNNAVENTAEKGDALKNYSNIYASFLERFNEGQTGSTEYKSAIQALLPDDVLAELGYDWEKAGRLLASDFWQAVFKEKGEDYGANFINSLKELADASDGEIRDAAGNLVASFEEVDGAIQYNIEDVDGLASVLGTTPDLIYSIIDATGIFSSQLQMTSDEAYDLAKSLGALTDAGNGAKSINIDKLVSGLVDAGKSDAEIWDIYNALKAMDGVSLDNIPFNLQDVINKAKETSSETNAASDSVDKLDDKKAEPKVTVNKSAFETGVKSIETTLARLSHTTTTVTIRQKTVTESAGGSSYHPGGLTLVNEEGPEIIQERGTARIAGGGAPTLTNIEQGAIVYTASETKDILGGGTFVGEVLSAKNGYSGSVPTTKGKSGASSSSSKKKSSSSKKSSSKKKSSSSSKKGGGGGDDALKNLQDQLALLEAQYELMIEQGASAEDLISKNKEIQDLIMRIVEKMRETGTSEEDIVNQTKEWYEWQKKVEEVQKNLWDELEKAVNKELEKAKKARDAALENIDAQLEALEAERKKTDERLTAEEKILAVQKAQEALEKAKNSRTVRYYNAKTGQWEWGANAADVKSAQEALENAQKDYDDYLADKAYQEERERLEKEKDRINKKYDDIEAKWDKILDSLEEPTRAIADILKDIANVGTPEMKKQVNEVNKTLKKLNDFIVDVSTFKMKNYHQEGILISGPSTPPSGYNTSPNKTALLSANTASAILTNSSAPNFASAMGGLGYVFGGNTIAMPNAISASHPIGIGTQNNGDTYQYGNVTLSEAQAKTTTVYDLARMARGLGVYNC